MISTSFLAALTPRRADGSNPAIPAGALLDADGDPILDANGDFMY